MNEKGWTIALCLGLNQFFSPHYEPLSLSILLKFENWDSNRDKNIAKAKH